MFLELIIFSWDQQRGWALEIIKDLQWLATFEIGVSPPGFKFLQQAQQVSKKQRDFRVRNAGQVSILMQATHDVFA